MFWGLIMEAGKKYSQKVEKAFHVSNASLDINNVGNEPVQVLLGIDNKQYIMCTLQKGKCLQAPIGLKFQKGDMCSFTINGPGHVHLAGYLLPEKRKPDSSTVQSVPKKSKTAELLEAIKSDDSDDSDDSDVYLTDMLEDEAGEEEEGADEEKDSEEEEEGEDSDEDEEVEDSGEDEEGEDSDEDEEGEDSDEDEEEVESESEKIKIPEKNEGSTKQNGVAKVKTPKLNQTPQQNEKNQKPNKSPKEQKTPGIDGSPLKKTLEGGVVIKDMKIGDGTVAKPGKIVQVYYEGRLKQNNKQFDATKQGPGFKFRLGKQEVIKAWDVGVSGMKVGGKRQITCPPNMAYGAKGSPPVIPPNSTLVFDVELKNVIN